MAVHVPEDRSLPGSRKSSSKAMTALSEYEKAEQEVSFRVVLQKKEVDGVVKICAKLDRTSYHDMDYKSAKKQPLEKEYTDMDAFGKCVADELASAKKALA